MEEILLGTIDRSILVFIPDPASTDGSGKTGLTHADLTVSYTRVETDNDVIVTDVTSSLTTLSALTDAHADWGVKEVSSTLAPGLYRLDVADAVFASGAWYAVVYVMITSSAAAATPKGFRLVNFDLQSQSAADLKDFADDGYDPSTNKVQGVVLADTVTTYTGNTPQTGDAFARIGANGAGLSAVPWNASWDAEVQSEVQDAIEANHLDHLLAATYDPASKPGAADALLNELVESDGGVARFTANALEQGPSGGGGVADWTADERTALRSILGIPASGTTPDDPTTGILDTIRDRAVAVEVDTQDIQGRLPAALVSGRMSSDAVAISGSTTAADNVEANIANLDATVSSRATPAQVNTEADTALADVGLTTTITGRIDAAVSTRATPAQVNTEADTALADVGLTTTVTGRIDAAMSTRASQASLDTVDGVVDAILADTGTDGVVLSAATANAVADALLDRTAGVETNRTLRQALRLILASAVGKSNGAETSTFRLRDTNDSKDRIVATTDENGNRTAVTLDAT